MRRFTSQNTISSVKRLVYSGSPRKGVLTDQGITAPCYLRPLSPEESGQNSLQWGIGYRMITEIGVDVEVGDVITISSTKYTVRGRADHDRGGNTAYQQYLVVLPQA
jgi:hypothetical protein